MLHLFIYLVCSVAFGAGMGTYYYADNFGSYSYANETGHEVEADESFDLLVHSLHFDIQVDDYEFAPFLAETRQEWEYDDEDCGMGCSIISLAPRAPPSIG